jgi:hypothetical protein
VTATLPPRGRFRPATAVGRWAFGLAVANVVLMFAWRLMGPLGGFPGLVAGLAGGICALVAIIRYRDRAAAVVLAVVPFVLVVLFVLAELLIGHE